MKEREKKIKDFTNIHTAENYAHGNANILHMNGRSFERVAMYIFTCACLCCLSIENSQSVW